jgi:sporulation protein YqfC
VAMFNFFGEIKEGIKNSSKIDLSSFSFVNVAGKILYVEGHLGLVTLSKEVISFRVKGGVIIASGEDLILIELDENTLKIGGKIKKVEQI